MKRGDDEYRGEMGQCEIEGTNHLTTLRDDVFFFRTLDVSIKGISYVGIRAFTLRLETTQCLEKEAGRMFGRNLPSPRVCLQESTLIEH